MYKIGVIGDKDSVQGFMALGMDVFPVSEGSEAASKLKEIAQDNYAIIYITEQYCPACEKEIARYKDEPLPAIIPIPGAEGSTGFGMENIRTAALRAIGSDMIFRPA